MAVASPVSPRTIGYPRDAHTYSPCRSSPAASLGVWSADEQGGSPRTPRIAPSINRPCSSRAIRPPTNRRWRRRARPVSRRPSICSSTVSPPVARRSRPTTSSSRTRSRRPRRRRTAGPTPTAPTSWSERPVVIYSYFIGWWRSPPRRTSLFYPSRFSRFQVHRLQ